MTSVTIRVLEGMEKGRVYSRLSLPISVGREDDNCIQLNDDRISRFHAKIQDLSGRMIVTDLDSTNGTKVNGHWIQQRVLHVGDVVWVGRCVLLIAECHIESNLKDSDQTAYLPGGVHLDDDSSELDFIEPLPGSMEESEEQFPNGPPELPVQLDRG